MKFWNIFFLFVILAVEICCQYAVFSGFEGPGCAFTQAFSIYVQQDECISLDGQRSFRIGCNANSTIALQQVWFDNVNCGGLPNVTQDFPRVLTQVPFQRCEDFIDCQS